MAIPELYTDGKIILTNGSTEIVGIGTAWSTRLRRGTQIHTANGIALIASDPDADEAADRPGDLLAKLALPWAGPTSPAAGEDYAAAIFRSGAQFAEGFGQLMERLAGKGMGLSSVGAPADSEGRDNDFRFDPTSNTLYFKFAGHWQAFTIRLSFDAYPATLQDRDTHDDEAAGFSAFVEGTEQWYVKRSASAGDWAGPFSYRGPRGGDRYDIAYQVPGRMLSGEPIGEGFLFTTTVEFDAGLLLSRASLRVAPQNEAVFSLQKIADPSSAFDGNGDLIPAEAEQVGSVTFAPGSKQGVFAAPAGFALDAGELLLITGPDPLDPNVFGVNITVSGFRNNT